MEEHYVRYLGLCAWGALLYPPSSTNAVFQQALKKSRRMRLKSNVAGLIFEKK
jgi:hypothetical protein